MTKKEDEKVDVVVMRLIISQLLSLIDNGKKITNEDAREWCYQENVFKELNKRFKGELTVFEDLHHYDYESVLKNIYGQIDTNHIGRFKNGLIGLVNLFQYAISDNSINWTKATPKYIL